MNIKKTIRLFTRDYKNTIDYKKKKNNNKKPIPDKKKFFYFYPEHIKED